MSKSTDFVGSGAEKHSENHIPQPDSALSLRASESDPTSQQQFVAQSKELKDSVTLQQQLQAEALSEVTPSFTEQAVVAKHKELGNRNKNITTKSATTISTMARCRFFFSEKGCSKGENCRFSHQIEVSPPPSHTDLHLVLGQDVVHASDTAHSHSERDSKTHSLPSNSKSRSNNNNPRNMPLCKFYAAGYCKWGNR